MNDQRLNAFVISLVIGVVFVALSSYLVAPCEAETECSGRILGDLMLDRNVELNTDGAWFYPFTVQNLMWLMFFVGLGEIWLRFAQGKAEEEQCNAGLLPEDDQVMLRAKDLGLVYNRTQVAGAHHKFFLQRLISRIALQFQAGRSIGQSNSILNSSLDLFHHEIELRYGLLRYLVWLIPTLGFIGTVIGIALALGEAGNVPDVRTEPEMMRPWIQGLTARLGVAFYTTLLALILSSILVYLLHIAQSREETALNRAGQYCLDNLINRLYEK